MAFQLGHVIYQCINIHFLLGFKEPNIPEIKKDTEEEKEEEEEEDTWEFLF